MAETLAMCPYCGTLFTYAQCHAAAIPGMIPTHDWPPHAHAVCPGSLQGPRNPETDRRPLWKDGGVS